MGSGDKVQNLISIKSKDKDNFVRDTVHPPNFGTDTSNVSICIEIYYLFSSRIRKKWQVITALTD